MIKYSIVSEFLGMSQEKTFKNGDSDSLAALTHFLQARDNSDKRYFAGQTKQQHQNSWNRIVYAKNSRSDIRSVPEQIHIPGLIPADVKFDVPFPPPQEPTFRFIDLFAGIGGMRIAFQKLGGQCVFSSEIDPFAKRTYEANFGEVPFGDITLVNENEVPGHDVLVAGFPCQAFSIAGKRRGFDETRGTLFFDVARIIDAKRPSVVFLENVKGLINHQKGETLKTILAVLRDDLGYFVPEPQILNAKFFGVPQNRERIIIVAFKSKKVGLQFSYPTNRSVSKTLSDILEPSPVESKYYLSEQYLTSMKEHRKRHEEKGHGFGYEIIKPEGIANAIVVGGMGRERNLVIDHRLVDRTPTTNIKGKVNLENVRRMTPREWARLQGFPDKFRIVVSDAQAYKQFGNSVAIPAIYAVAKRIGLS